MQLSFLKHEKSLLTFFSVLVLGDMSKRQSRSYRGLKNDNCIGRYRSCRYSSGGFSLMELVLTIAIFSIGSFAIAYVLIDANTTTQTVSYRTEALLLAREGLEASRAIRDNSWSGLTTGGPYGLSTSTGDWAFSGTSDTSGIFLRTINVYDIDPYTKSITSLVTWNTVGDKPQSISLTTQLTAWR